MPPDVAAAMLQSSESRPQPYPHPRLALPIEAEADVDAGVLAQINTEVGCRAVDRQSVDPGAGSLAGDDGGTVIEAASLPHLA